MILPGGILMFIFIYLIIITVTVLFSLYWSLTKTICKFLFYYSCVWAFFNCCAFPEFSNPTSKSSFYLFI